MIITTPPPPTDTEIRQISLAHLGQEPNRIETFKSGAWSHAYGLDTDHGLYVLRFSKTDEDFRRDAFAAQFATPNLPIPGVVAIDQWQHGWWCISERVPGRYLDTLTAEELRVTLPSLAAMLIAMRDVDSSGTCGYGDLDRHGNGRFASFADQLLEITKDALERGDGDWYTTLQQHHHALITLERGAEILKQQVPFLGNDRQLIHMDTLNRNVNVIDNHISGIYDWGCAMWGDAVYDLAWFAFWEPWYPQWEDVNLSQTLIDLVGIRGDHKEQRLNCCMLHIGLDHIRYNAFTGNHQELLNAAAATERLLGSMQ